MVLGRHTYAVVKKPIYRRLKHIRHHERSIFYHNLRVARVAYRLGKIIERLSFWRMRKKALIRGALLHDFFFYDWRRERPVSGKLHAFEHPRESSRHAVRFYAATRRERNIILSHMWPLGRYWPCHVESWLVTIADKWVSTKEFWRKWFP
ncbi:MAG: HD domain-containing protein [Brevinematales bacterium]|nr:HD domain-containing protein [Brevinematales bacterium]